MSTGARAMVQEEVVPFRADDGFECNLIHIKGPKAAIRGPVMVVHGAGVRANLFRPPVETTFVDALLAEGYDVWLENWRASIDLKPNRWTLDQVALYDHPAAVRTVVEKTRCDELKAVIHCQGSTSFMMSAVAGLIPQVKVIVSNAVSLHPVIPAVSAAKIKAGVFTMKAATDFLDPQWGLHAPNTFAKAIVRLVKMTHHECDNIVCRMASFVYGTGFPTLWSHEHLNDATHEWLKDEFAQVPLTFFEQMAKCVDAGHLISVEGKPGLPGSFVEREPQTNARFALFAGEENRCFLAESQRKTFDFLRKHRPGVDSLYIVPNYGHLDVFLGKTASRDVYPLMINELNGKD